LRGSLLQIEAKPQY